MRMSNFTVDIAKCGCLTLLYFSLFIESFAQRAAVRTALTKDQEWQEKYMSHMLPLLDKQENEITYLVPWCAFGSTEKDGTLNVDVIETLGILAFLKV